MPNEVYDDGDDWTNLKQDGADGGNFISLGDVRTCHLSGTLGDGDKVDYAQFTFAAPASLSFTITADAAVTFTLYKLTGTPGRYSLKTLQTTKTKRIYERDEDGDIISVSFEAASTPYFFPAVADAAPCTYYFSVKPVSSTTEPYYTISYNSYSSSFFEKAGDGKWDDWTDMARKGMECTDLCVIKVHEMFDDGNRVSDWVGFNDAEDYTRFTVDDVTKLSFILLTTSNRVQISICRLAGKPGKYRLAALTTATVSKIRQTSDDNDEYDDYTFIATTKSVLLEQGEYYIRVKSLNAKKGGSADYSFSINVNGSSFFEKAAEGKNDDWGDLAEKGKESTELGTIDVQDMYEFATRIPDWIGLNDAFDYRRFTVPETVKLSFRLMATSKNVQISICKLAGKPGKYKLVALATATVSKSKPRVINDEDFDPNHDNFYDFYYVDEGYDYSALTKSLILEKGQEYYIRVKSLDAKTGGSADYTISVNGRGSSFFEQAADGKGDDWTDMVEKGAKSKELGGELFVSEFTWFEEEVFCRDWVGTNDAVDFMRLTVENPAKLTFYIYATDAAKITIYGLEGEVGNYSLKPLKSLSLVNKPYSYFDWREDIIYNYKVTVYKYLIERGEYFIGVESTKAKTKTGGSADYLIETGIADFNESDSGWNNRLLDDAGKLAPEAEEGDLLDQRAIEITKNTDTIMFDTEALRYEHEITDEDTVYWDNFVGFGDEFDYLKITLGNRAELSFTVSATVSAKFIICQLVREEDGTFTQNLLQTTTLTKKTQAYYYSDWVEVYNRSEGDWEDVEVTRKKTYTYYGANTKGIMLDAGEYYICMQATNAKKGGSTYYNVSLNKDGCIDLPDEAPNNLVISSDADDGWNNFLYGWTTNVLGSREFAEGTMELKTTEITGPCTVGFDSVAPSISGWKNFVGYGDEADYARIVLSVDAALSFNVEASDSVRLTIWSAVWRKPSIIGIYKMNSIQRTTFTVQDGRMVVSGTTDAISLVAGEYFVSVESTNALKGGAAYYNVSVADFSVAQACALDGPESGFAMPETEYVAFDGLNSGMPDGLVAGAAAASSFPDPALEDCLAVRTAGLLA